MKMSTKLTMVCNGGLYLITDVRVMAKTVAVSAFQQNNINRNRLINLIYLLFHIQNYEIIPDLKRVYIMEY